MLRWPAHAPVPPGISSLRGPRCLTHSAAQRSGADASNVPAVDGDAPARYGCKAKQCRQQAALPGAGAAADAHVRACRGGS